MRDLAGFAVAGLLVLVGCYPTETGYGTLAFQLDKASCNQTMQLDFYVDGAVARTALINPDNIVTVTVVSGYHSAGARESGGGFMFPERDVDVVARGSTIVELVCN